MKPSHRQSNTKLYARWTAMIQRCTNPHTKSFKNYGGRGIKVCKRWLKFENFLADMGVPASGMTLERKDNSKGYNKSNCVWAGRDIQGANRRNVVVFKGLTLRQWSDKLGIPARTLAVRFRKHGDVLADHTPRTSIECFGEAKTLYQWLRDPRCVVQRTTLARRIQAGWPAHEALTKPSQKTN